jgi:2',3'-cyclic-nucleotide 2'-phosphodiesterase/3'-nucleotidase
MHGRIFPIDYYTNKYDNVGIAKCATLVKQARKDDPDLLLLDSGDTIQGTPLEYLHNKRNNTPPIDDADDERLEIRCDGRRQSRIQLRSKSSGEARSEAKFPWLSANTYETGAKGTPLQRTISLTSSKIVQGVKIGILGLTTPGIPYWENKTELRRA